MATKTVSVDFPVLDEAGGQTSLNCPRCGSAKLYMVGARRAGATGPLRVHFHCETCGPGVQTDLCHGQGGDSAEVWWDYALVD